MATLASEIRTAPVSPGLALLRVPFPEHQISKLPKGNVMLDYVGHAALTDRLLEADPTWSWEPLSFDEKGLPRLDEIGGLWIKLTVCGVTRLGYGHAGTKKGGDAIKELIGDALRNAAMRFGAALDLWHKGDLHGEEAEEEPAGKPSRREAPANPPKQDAPPKEPSPEQREAAAVEAIKMAVDEGRLNKLEISVIERTGSVFTPTVASRLLALISERRKQIAPPSSGTFSPDAQALVDAAAPLGPLPLGRVPPQGF